MDYVKTPKKVKKKEPEKFDYNSMLKCPVCGGKRVRSCRCPRADSTCENGHQYHLCTIHEKIVIGLSNHGQSGCTCGEGK